MIVRRAFIGFWTTALALLAGCALAPSAQEFPPIVFVHGNGDTAALWQTTIWRFESNGWPRERLYAIDVPYPLARDDDTKPQPGRSSTAEQMAYLRAEVDKVRQAHRRAAGGADRQFARRQRDPQLHPERRRATRWSSHAMLGGGTNHGVQAVKGYNEGNEFNGTGAVPDRAQRAQERGRRRGHRPGALADHPLGQQRQVRPARRRVDRRQGQAHQRQLRRRPSSRAPPTW